MAPYEIKKECYLFRSDLADAGRMLFFMVEQMFLLTGQVWSMPNADIQCGVDEGGDRRAEKLV